MTVVALSRLFGPYGKARKGIAEGFTDPESCRVLTHAHGFHFFDGSATTVYAELASPMLVESKIGVEVLTTSAALVALSG